MSPSFCHRGFSALTATPKPTVKNNLLATDQTVASFLEPTLVANHQYQKIAVGFFAATGGDDRAHAAARYAVPVVTAQPQRASLGRTEYSLSKNISGFISCPQPNSTGKIALSETAISLAQDTLRAVSSMTVFVLSEQTEYFSAGPELATAASDRRVSASSLCGGSDLLSTHSFAMTSHRGLGQ